MKKMYSKKYGVFCWVYCQENDKPLLMAFNVRLLDAYSVKVYKKENTNLDWLLKYADKRSSENWQQFFKIGKPFLVRITGKEVKMKTGTLKLNWRNKALGCDHHEYVPFEFIPNSKSCKY